MIVRELISRFGFKVDKKDFKKVESRFSKLQKIAGAAVAFVAAGAIAKAFTSVTAGVAAMGDAIDKTSKRIGVEAQALQELQFAAGLAGASHQDLASALRILSRNADEAGQGTKEYKDEFDRLGVSVKDSSGQLKSADALIVEMGDGLANLKTDMARVAIAQKLLGRGGAAMLPLLIQGTAAIREQRIEAQQLGLFDRELIDLSVDLTDTNLRYSQSMQALKNIIAKQFLPGIIATKKAIVEWVKANREWLKQGITKAFDFLGRVLTAVWWVIKDVARGVWWLASTTGGLVKELWELHGVGGKLAVLMAILGAALFFPLIGAILLKVAIALLVADFVLWWKEGAKADTIMGRLDKSLGGVLGVMRHMSKTGEDFNLLGTAWSFWADQADRLVGSIADIARGLGGMDLGLLGRWLIGSKTPEEEEAGENRKKIYAAYVAAFKKAQAAWKSVTVEERKALMVTLQRAETAAVGAGSFTPSAATAARVAKGMVINNNTNLTVNTGAVTETSKQIADVIVPVVRKEIARGYRQTIRTSAPATAR